jgi:hypothetical protein
VHVKENILYYMQAIWSHEPPDQRFFRLYNKDVPIPTAKLGGVAVDICSNAPNITDLFLANNVVSAELKIPPKVGITVKKLVEVADLDTVLGYKGNYMIFALKDNNYLTLYMMQEYLDVGAELRLRDPDEFGNFTVDELEEIATCAFKRDPDEFAKYRVDFKNILIKRLSSPRKDSDLVVVPTSSLYIEALVGTHPLLEEFKLIHRALDVKKVQAEVRHAELENIRLAARALRGKDEDPDIEKKILIETDTKDITIEPEA